jgi:hypothetical protein
LELPGRVYDAALCTATDTLAPIAAESLRSSLQRKAGQMLLLLLPQGSKIFEIIYQPALS